VSGCGVCRVLRSERLSGYGVCRVLRSERLSGYGVCRVLRSERLSGYGVCRVLRSERHPVNIMELFCEGFLNDFSKEQRSSLRMILGSKHVGGAILSV
jgi:hypothetical protein